MHGTCGKEVLFDPLRGREGDDDPDVPLRTSWVRRKGLRVRRDTEARPGAKAPSDLGLIRRAKALRYSEVRAYDNPKCGRVCDALEGGFVAENSGKCVASGRVLTGVIGAPDGVY